MKICILDDDIKFSKYLKQLIGKKGEWDINIYQHIDEMKYEEDIYFIDIDLNGKLSGFDVASTIKNKNKNNCVIFVSSHDEFVFEAYKYNIFRYLRKRYIEDEIDEVLTELKIINYVEIKYDGEYINLKSDDIEYLYSLGNYLYIKYHQKEYKIRNTINKFLNINKLNLLRASSSYYINARFINKIDENKMMVRMSDNKLIGVSKINLSKIVREYTLLER